jgi:hypothetical protein
MVLWRPTKNGIKSGKNCSKRHLARTIQKVHKITKDTGYWNIKSGFFTVVTATPTLQTGEKHLMSALVACCSMYESTPFASWSRLTDGRQY